MLYKYFMKKIYINFKKKIYSRIIIFLLKFLYEYYIYNIFTHYFFFKFLVYNLRKMFL